MSSRRLILASLVALLGAFGAVARADAPMFYSNGGAAINGYDPVAYFTRGEPTKGKAGYSVTWKGAVWRFVSLENRDTFEANPRAYAPQYGGYCAYAVSQGRRDPTKPDAWRIVDGKLYLIRTRVVRSVWAMDLKANIANGNANWPDVLSLAGSPNY